MIVGCYREIQCRRLHYGALPTWSSTRVGWYAAIGHAKGDTDRAGRMPGALAEPWPAANGSGVIALTSVSALDQTPSAPTTWEERERH